VLCRNCLVAAFLLNLLCKSTYLFIQRIIKVNLFFIKPNPTVTNVKNGVRALKDAKADFIVAIGGGSSMDTAKGIGIVSNNPKFDDVVSLEGVTDTKNKTVPIIALPTTAGTAAETTINYVIIDETKQKKMVCVDPNDII
jgi:lactaldehyde reductase